MRTTIATVMMCLLVACGAADLPETVDAGLAQSDAAQNRRDAADANPPKRDTRGSDAAAGAVCVVGESLPCQCQAEGQMSLPGVKVCLEPAGVFTQCGCAFEHPHAGPTCDGGKVKCRATINEETQYAARHCCTEAGQCGLSNPDVTGGKCVERGKEPIGKATSECGESVIPFVQTEDCCRPDGSCGLWLRQGDNWDELGCVERTGMAKLLKNSGTLGFFLFLIGRGSVLDEIAPKSCAY